MKRLIISLSLLGAAHGASAAEYRSITLADGRVIAAEIKSVTATEMVLDTPQGEVRISPSDLRDMAPMSDETYASLPPWQVLVLPFGGESNVTEDLNFGELYSLRVLKSIDAINPITVDSLATNVKDSTKSALSSCGTNLQCATRHGADAEVDVVVMGRIDPVSEKRVLTLGAVFVDSPAARKRGEIDYTGSLLEKRQEITKQLYSSLFLTPPDKAEVAVFVTPTPASPTSAPSTASTKPVNSANLVWAPLPGITALKQNNTVGFATALGVVGAGTATSVYLSGHATYSAPQMIAMTTLTSYGLTVFMNHLLQKQ